VGGRTADFPKSAIFALCIGPVAELSADTNAAKSAPLLHRHKPILAAQAAAEVARPGRVPPWGAGQILSVLLVEVVTDRSADTGHAASRTVAVCTGRAGIDRTGGKMVHRAFSAVGSVASWNPASPRCAAIGAASGRELARTVASSTPSKTGRTVLAKRPSRTLNVQIRTRVVVVPRGRVNARAGTSIAVTPITTNARVASPKGELIRQALYTAVGGAVCLRPKAAVGAD